MSAVIRPGRSDVRDSALRGALRTVPVITSELCGTLRANGRIAASARCIPLRDALPEANESIERVDAVLSAKSAWEAEATAAFLRDAVLPVRLSTLDSDGFPHITSLWFQFRRGRLLCCTQMQSLVCRHLLRDPRVGFEVAVNEPPYFGVSGRGEARILEGNPTALLNELMHHYLKDGNAKLKAWLLSRIDREVTIEVSPSRLTSWDFRGRMTPVG